MSFSEASNFLIADRNSQQLLLKEDTCDKYDYLAAVLCGVIGGVVDIFLVGAPNDSILGKWTDSQVDNAVKGFAKMLGWNPKDSQKDNIASAIGFLENGGIKANGERFDGFKVNYDQRHTADVNGEFNMSTKNHHIMSLSHSPDIIGLFFSILNQFTSTSSFISNGKIITIKTDTFELQGGNLVAKLFCGIANWFGHIMSDIAGSSGARGGTGRGSGIVAPFFELFQFCKFGKFRVGNDLQDLATIAVRAFEEGYDFRFSLATAIPVVITDLSIRLIWSLRRYFQFEKPLNECIPSGKHADLRIMLLLGNGTLCVLDGLDAGIRSGGNFLLFFMRLNLVGWFRFITLVLKEVFIRVGISDPLQKTVDAFIRINEALQQYLRELAEIDFELFQKETQEYISLVSDFEKATTVEELNVMLIKCYESSGLKKPWSGDFNEHMANKNARLIFE